MDFPTALRYLMAGRTIRRTSADHISYRLGTFRETYSENEKKHFTDDEIIVSFWSTRPTFLPIQASVLSHELLATDWELAE